MYYFKYNTIVNGDGSYISLYHYQFGDKIKEYDAGTVSEPNGRVVSVDLDEIEIKTLFIGQRVELKEITKEKFDAWKLTSNEYKSSREIEKQARDSEIVENTIVYNNKRYDANDLAMNRISSRLAVFNYKYNQLIYNGETPAMAYNLVYNESFVDWRTSDKEVVRLSIKELAYLLELINTCVEKITLKY